MSIPGGSNSRFAIISWINDTLLLPLTKIEQLGSGSVYCQLLDAGYPERVPLHKVKWDAKLEVDFLHNFKILVTSFEYLGIEKKIDVQKLSKAKYQDNLQFVQWLKNHIQQKIDYQKYEPLKRRNYAKIYLGFTSKGKFNVTLSSNNKENLDNSSSYMKSSVKSNASMKNPPSLNTCRSSTNVLSRSYVNSNMQVKREERVTQQSKQKEINNKRKSVGPISFISLNQKNMNKNKSLADIVEIKGFAKNISVIQSEGSADQFF